MSLDQAYIGCNRFYEYRKGSLEMKTARNILSVYGNESVVAE